MMENVNHKIADMARMMTGLTLSPHASPRIMPQVIPGLFYSVNHALWDAIDEQIWFGICGEVENNLRFR